MLCGVLGVSDFIGALLYSSKEVGKKFMVTKDLIPYLIHLLQM